MSITNRFPGQAFALAIVVELSLVVAACLMLARAAPLQPASSDPVPLTLVSEEPAPPEPVSQPKPKPEPLRQQPKHQVPTKTKVAAAKPQPQVAAAPQQERPTPEPAPLAEAPGAFTEPASAPPPPPAVSGKADPNAAYAAKVRAAVQAALVYPPAAAALHFAGRVRVEFHLRDSVASQARVVIPCGIGIIDRAALQSVQNASYPAPPSDMQDRDLVYQVWVDFVR